MMKGTGKKVRYTVTSDAAALARASISETSSRGPSAVYSPRLCGKWAVNVFRHWPFSAPLVAAEPIVDHRMSQRFRFFAASGHNFWNAFDITGMNDDSPMVPFNPGTEGVPYA